MAALSMKLKSPVLANPLPGYSKQVQNPGGSSVVRISDDEQTVRKSPQLFHLNGCDERTTREYQAFSRESQNLVQREKEVYQRLGRHEAILQCLKFDEDGLVFPYMKNGDLRHFLGQGRKIEQAWKTQCIRRILRSLEYAHSKQVLHCDISARNVLVTEDLSVVLCDFSGSFICEKPQLVQYETRYNKVHSKHGDLIEKEVFAIGCLMYEIMTAKRPFEEMSDEEVEVCYHDEVFPSTTDVPLGAIIEKCWTGVYSSMSTILQAVDDAFSDS